MIGRYVKQPLLCWHVASYLDCRTQQRHDQVLKEAWISRPQISVRSREDTYSYLVQWRDARRPHLDADASGVFMTEQTECPHEPLLIWGFYLSGVMEGTSLRNWAVENNSVLHRMMKNVKETKVWGSSTCPSYLGNPVFWLAPEVGSMLTRHSFLNEYGSVSSVHILYIRKNIFSRIQ